MPGPAARPGDQVVLHRGAPVERAPLSDQDDARAVLAGALVSEGWTSGAAHTDEDVVDEVHAAWRRLAPQTPATAVQVSAGDEPAYTFRVAPGALDETGLGELEGKLSADKAVPAVVWAQGPTFKARFLQALFEVDGSCSRRPRNGVQLSCSTRSEQLGVDVQQLLLELGIVSRRCLHATGQWTVSIDNRRDARLFAERVGFRGPRQVKLWSILGKDDASTSLSSDHVPYVAAYLRAVGATAPADRDWLRRHDVDRIERWERDGELIRSHVTDTEALAVVEPLVDGMQYYAEVASIEDAGVSPVFSLRVDSDEHSFLSNGFVSHNTECRLAPLAMEMLREIDEETVDFTPNYDGRSQEPTILPSRIPNLLVNGSSGIAVGMATNIPPHNLREVAAGVHWALDNPTASSQELLDALLERVHGPDFPTGGLIVGRDGIAEAYRTGRGSVRMRAVVEVDEDAKGRTILVVSELPYQVNPDNLAEAIADLVKDGKMGGIADVRDEGSQRLGQRLVIVLKRDAIAKVVLNNLYKHTQLQYTFGCNMLAIVDGVPRTLRLDQFVEHYVAHQVDVIVRRTRFQLRRAEERAHILRALGKALDRLDDVIALIRASASAEAARADLMALLDIDELQAVAILDMQLRRLAALERQRVLDDLAEREREIADLQAILADPTRQRRIIGEELTETVERYGDERRTRIVAFEGDLSAEDLIAQEDVVVTVTRGGYAKRTKTDLYRSQRRGGRGVQGASLREDDIVERFFVTTTHHWLLFLTDKGRVYRAKAHELPEANRNGRGQHVANILAFQPDERIAQVIALRDYAAAPYLVLATRKGLVKKTALTEYDNGRSSGLIAINLREDDELIAAALISADDDLLLVSRRAKSIRFQADDEALRPMGRATSGVMGMRLVGDDELLAMQVARADTGLDDDALLVVTDGGFGKRTRLSDYKRQNRGGQGVLTARIEEKRGTLVGALIVSDADEIFAITSAGVVIRMSVQPLRYLSRATSGVKLVALDAGSTVVAVAHNGEAAADVATDEEPGEVLAPVETGEGREAAVDADPATDTDDAGEVDPSASTADGVAGARVERDRVQQDEGDGASAPDDAQAPGDEEDDA